MRKISEIQSVLKTNELLTTNELMDVKGGRSFKDDKRRQRPGGGTSTTSPMRINIFNNNNTGNRSSVHGLNYSVK